MSQVNFTNQDFKISQQAGIYNDQTSIKRVDKKLLTEMGYSESVPVILNHSRQVNDREKESIQELVLYINPQDKTAKPILLVQCRNQKPEAFQIEVEMEKDPNKTNNLLIDSEQIIGSIKKEPIPVRARSGKLYTLENPSNDETSAITFHFSALQRSYNTSNGLILGNLVKPEWKTMHLLRDVSQAPHFGAERYRSMLFSVDFKSAASTIAKSALSNFPQQSKDVDQYLRA
jgi:hypothetical protein